MAETLGPGKGALGSFLVSKKPPGRPEKARPGVAKEIAEIEKLLNPSTPGKSWPSEFSSWEAYAADLRRKRRALRLERALGLRSGSMGASESMTAA
jgi:hypothetical protein